MDADPGTKWAYNSGGSHLMAGIVKAATKRSLDEFAKDRLFQPLGIRDFHWKKTPTGEPDAEGGLYLTAHDLAKIGYLYLRDGMWEGRRVLPPAGWPTRRRDTRKASGRAGTTGSSGGSPSRGGADVWAGRGYGGQLLIVIPSREIVAVVNAWNVFGDKVRNVFDPLVDALTAP